MGTPPAMQAMMGGMDGMMGGMMGGMMPVVDSAKGAVMSLVMKKHQQALRPAVAAIARVGVQVNVGRVLGWYVHSWFMV